IAPRTPIEEIVAVVWSDVLGLERIGLRDNFFDLGGHSLLAMQIISRAEEAFQIKLPLRTLFESPTVAAFAASIALLPGSKNHEPPPPIRPIDRGMEIALSFPQQRLWFLHQLDPDSPAFNLPAAFRLSGKIDFRALICSFREVMRRHEVLRTSFHIVNGQIIQAIVNDSSLKMPIVDLSRIPQAHRERLAQALIRYWASLPFNLSQGPLVRTNLIRLGDEDHIIISTVHHIVSDGWSMGLITQELSALYNRLLEGQPSSLKDLPIQYADFAHWQRLLLQGSTLEASLSYWMKQLANAPVLQLPVD